MPLMPDDAAGGGAGAHHLVGDVARMVVDDACAAVREDHRLGGRGHRFQCRAVAGVAHADDHAHALHLGDGRAAERGQAGVLVLAAAAEPVVAVVGQQHPAHAELAVQRNQARLVGDRVAALDVEADGQPPAGACALDVVDAVDQHVVLGPRQKPVPEHRQHADVFLDALLAEADVEHRDVDACIAVALQPGQEGLVMRAQRHAAVVVPDEAVLDQREGAGGNGGRGGVHQMNIRTPGFIAGMKCCKGLRPCRCSMK